ncbi:WD repeat-containing protein 82 isoform X1 [Drosophila subpulchrella]|uniref:WD repeat-containing protein 82 isoform X1 n=1 Tax=Drosophila subpulchrella TaxID=1486046 RepID=UPI0018A143E4|nr:WD repeat-containing protein 82 isoform X1 [Drosophila subpulchrella]
MSIRLNDDAMRQFRVAKVFQETDEHKLSLDFSPDGRRLLSCDHSALSVFSSTRQTELCQVHMHHYLPEVACFTQQDTRALHSTSKYDFAIRCLDLETRHCVRSFSGHSKSVHRLASQPGNDNVFVSVGRDDQVYVWDFRSSTHIHHMKKLQGPLCAFDPAGLVLATSTDTERIEIHDVRMLGEQPCLKFVYQVNDKAKWTQLQFAPNGKTMLLSTDHSWCFSVSAFDGTFQQSFTGYANQLRQSLDATYTPDSQFILSGADEGRIHIWRAEDGYPVAVLKGNNVGPVRCLRFNPRATMFVSSDLLLAFWMPMANGVYDWVERLPPGETVSFKDEELDEKEVEPLKPPIAMPQPLVDMALIRTRLNRKRTRSQVPIVDLTKQPDKKDTLEEGEITDD